jgi:dephospho-CoA kinase
MGGATLKIALTGVMGAGKSRVAELFRDEGARVVDADEVGRCLLEPFKSGWTALREEFADRFFNVDRTVDRKKLREAIFNDEALRAKINSLLHPLIRRAIDKICAEAAGRKAGSAQRAGALPAITVVEVPLLYEVGWQDDFDLVVVVAAEEELCLERVMKRDGVARDAALAAFGAQMSSAAKAEMADYVIDNSGDLAATARQVKNLYAELVK